MRDYTMRFVFDRKNETDYRDKLNGKPKKGKDYKAIGLLQIEVKKDKTTKRVFVSTHVRIKPEQFSDKNGFTCRNHDNAKGITGKAHSIYRDVETFVSSDKCKSINDVKFWDKENFSEISVVEFIRSELRRTIASSASIEITNSFITRLEEYGKIKNFQDITYENILGLDAQLKKTITSEPTLYKRHSLFKKYINEAINRELFKGINPYNLFKPQKGKGKEPIFLLDDEIDKIRKYSPDYGYLERARDLFLFQCFTGLAYVDAQNFKKEDVIIENGRIVIYDTREKTDVRYIIPFLEEAEQIAEKYKYDLPKLSNQKYNAYLKEVATGAGITKHITSHVARHTFATYLLNKDIPIETVSKVLGHSNIKQTQHYAKLLGKKIMDDFDKAGLK